MTDHGKNFHDIDNTPAEARARTGTSVDGDNGLQRLMALAGDFVGCYAPDGELRDCSLQNDRFCGYEQAELLGAAFMQHVHVADRPSFLCALDRAAHQQERVVTEFRLQAASSDNGARQHIWLEMTASSSAPEGQGENESVRVLAMCRDISRFKQREQELTAALQTAEEANEAKNRYLNNMSHDLRTPLNAIIGFSEMMSMPGIITKNEAQMNEYAGIIHNSGKHLLGLVGEVLDMSRLEMGKYELAPESFTLAELVEESIEQVQTEAESKNVRVGVQDFDDSLEMFADRRAARQLLVNLMARRIKATEGNGRVRLSIKGDDGAVVFAALTPAGDALADGERPLHGSLIEALAGLMQGEADQLVDEQGGSRLQVRLPLRYAAGGKGDNVVRLAGPAAQASLGDIRKSA